MLKVVKAPNSVLRNAAKPVKKLSQKYLQIIDEMINTCKSFQDPEGVGLAATQINISEQFFIAKFDTDLKDKKEISLEFPEEFTAVFNPKITWFSKRSKMTLEGCLSIPEYYGEVTRPSAIKVIYTDINGNIVHKSLKGINATIFQHEYDHLHGKLFIDYVMSQQSRLFKITGKDKTGADIFEEVKLP